MSWYKPYLCVLSLWEVWERSWWWGNGESEERDGGPNKGKCVCTVSDDRRLGTEEEKERGTGAPRVSTGRVNEGMEKTRPRATTSKTKEKGTQREAKQGKKEKEARCWTHVIFFAFVLVLAFRPCYHDTLFPRPQLYMHI